MRKLIVSNIMSLDGFAEGPNSELDWVATDADFFAYALDMLNSVDTLLFGRKTYLHMAAFWPSAPTGPIADKMNSLPKIVFSSTLTSVDWKNSTLTEDDAGIQIARHKQLSGGDMVILGSASLAASLLQDELIDEYRVILNPILLGAGKPLFPNILKRLKLKLSRTQTLASGVVILYYHPQF